MIVIEADYRPGFQYPDGSQAGIREVAVAKKSPAWYLLFADSIRNHYTQNPSILLSWISGYAALSRSVRHFVDGAQDCRSKH